MATCFFDNPFFQKSFFTSNSFFGNAFFTKPFFSCGGQPPVPVDVFDPPLFGGSNVTITPITDGFNAVATGAGLTATNRLNFYTTTPTTTNTVVTFTATVNSGSFVISDYFDGTSTQPLPDGVHVVVDGANHIRVGAVAQDSIELYADSQDVTAYDIDLTIISVMEL